MSERDGLCFCFFFNDTATTEIYTLSLHDALPILPGVRRDVPERGQQPDPEVPQGRPVPGHQLRDPVHHQHPGHVRSEEHTSELQSQSNLVCRLLLEKKKNYPSTLDTP